MRPPKVVLLTDADEARLSLRRMVLRLRGYRVFSASSGEEAIVFIRSRMPGTIDLVVCVGNLRDMAAVELLGRARQLHRCLPLLALVNAGPYVLQANSSILPMQANSADVLEAVRLLCTRQRGPKKRDSLAELPGKKPAGVVTAKALEIVA